MSLARASGLEKPDIRAVDWWGIRPYTRSLQLHVECHAACIIPAIASEVPCRRYHPRNCQWSIEPYIRSLQLLTVGLILLSSVAQARRCPCGSPSLPVFEQINPHRSEPGDSNLPVYSFSAPLQYRRPASAVPYITAGQYSQPPEEAAGA